MKKTFIKCRNCGNKKHIQEDGFCSEKCYFDYKERKQLYKENQKNKYSQSSKFIDEWGDEVTEN